MQVEIWGREATYFIIMPRASLPALLGKEGEAGSRAAWLGAWALELGDLSLNLGSVALELYDLGYVTLFLCGSVSTLQNRDLNHKSIAGLEVGQLSISQMRMLRSRGCQ